MHTRLPHAQFTKAALALAALSLSPQLARAAEADTAGYPALPGRIGDLSLKLEPGVAFPLTNPQSHIFKTGGSETIKALWTINEYIDVGPSATFLTLPSETAGGEAGTAWTFGGGLRARRPRDGSDEFMGISPWVDADVLYVRTGDLNRPGFAAAD